MAILYTTLQQWFVLRPVTACKTFIWNQHYRCMCMWVCHYVCVCVCVCVHVGVSLCVCVYLLYVCHCVHMCMRVFMYFP